MVDVEEIADEKNTLDVVKSTNAKG